MMKAILTALLVLAACNKSASPVTEELLDKPYLNLEEIDPKGLVTTPGAISLAVGESASISVTGLFPYGKIAFLTKGLSWEVADSSVLTIDQQGRTVAHKAGATQIRLKYRNMEQLIPVTVTSAAPMQLILLPAKRTLSLARSTEGPVPLPFTIETYSLLTDGRLIDIHQETEWEWNGSDGISRADDGSFVARKPGVYTMKARYANLEAEHQLTVMLDPLKVSKLEATQTNIILRFGDAIVLPVKATMNDGTINTTLSGARYTFSDPGLQITGLSLRARALGQQAVTIRMDDQELILPIYIRDTEVTGIFLTPTAFSMKVGEKKNFSAEATFSDGERFDITTVMDSTVENGAIATSNGSVIEAHSVGTTAIVVSYRGFSVRTPVVVTPAVLSYLDIRPASFSMAAGESVNFQVFGVYTDSQEVDLTGVVTARGLVITRADTTAPGVLMGKSQGSTKLSVSYVDTATGLNMTASAPIEIKAPILQSIVFDPENSTKAMGRFEDYRVKGRYSDTTEIDITSLVDITADVYSPGLSYVAEISRTASNRLRVRGRAIGVQKVIATYEGISGSTTFTSTPKEVDRVDIIRTDGEGSTNTWINKGSSVTFIARATYSDLTTENVTESNADRTVTWNAPNPAHATLDVGTNERIYNANVEGSAGFSVSLVDSVGTKSGSFTPDIMIPCSGNGRNFQYYCWFLGQEDQSCDEVCGGESRVNHSATVSVVGKNGSDQSCREVLQRFYNPEPSFNTNASAPVGLGCAVYDNGLNISLREKTLDTMGDAKAPDFRRVCSCE